MTSRSLADWLAYLEQLHPTAIDMGLDRVRAVAARMAMTRPAPLVVTVTGTNGKGSTCAFIASLLNAQGLKIGSYSSPHLLRYNERVLLSGREASDAELCEAFAVVEAARGEISLTYFEMGTLAAFWLFERALKRAARRVPGGPFFVLLATALFLAVRACRAGCRSVGGRARRAAGCRQYR